MSRNRKPPGGPKCLDLDSEERVGSLRHVARSAYSQFIAKRSSWGRLLEKKWTKSDGASQKAGSNVC